MTTHRHVRDKVLGYRDLTGASQDAHDDHWNGFVWEGGPWMVALDGPWGRPQVWAASEEEGLRVLLHAAAISGWDLADPSVSILSKRVTNPRYGMGGRFRVKKKMGVVMVSKRDGPSGAPFKESPG